MMYVGKNKLEPEEDDVKIPNRYSGIAFESDGTPRDIAAGPHYDPDGEELRRAEELFRRGYVFDDQMPERYTSADPTKDTDNMSGAEPEQDTVHTESETAIKTEEYEGTEPTAASSAKPQMQKTQKTQNKPEPASGFKGLFGRITTEELLIGGLIVLLLSSGADDELLVMLAVLLFC